MTRPPWLGAPPAIWAYLKGMAYGHPPAQRHGICGGGGIFGDQTGSHSLASAELVLGPNVIKLKLPRLLAFYPFDFGPWDVKRQRPPRQGDRLPPTGARLL